MIVWLASYPRSGNTFFRVVLNSVFNIKTYSIYNDTSDIGADEKTSEIVGHQFLPEDFNLNDARASDTIYYIKTHELLENMTKMQFCSNAFHYLNNLPGAYNPYIVNIFHFEVA